MRFLGVTAATITIRISSAPLSLVSWSGIATLAADDTTGGGSPIYPVHNSFTGRDVADAHPLASITGLVDALASMPGRVVIRCTSGPMTGTPCPLKVSGRTWAPG